MDQAALNNRSNQKNPNNSNYQGGSSGKAVMDQASLDNYSNQKNPNNPNYRGGHSGNSSTITETTENSGSGLMLGFGLALAAVGGLVAAGTMVRNRKS